MQATALHAVGPIEIRETPGGLQANAEVLPFDKYASMVFGAHLVLYSQDAEADRRFLSEKFGMSSVDAGHGWLIFALPPAEVAVHPAESPGAELYLMCDDLEEEMDRLAGQGVTCSPVEEARWGSITKFALPGGGQVALYEPRHPLAIGDGASR